MGKRESADAAVEDAAHEATVALRCVQGLANNGGSAAAVRNALANDADAQAELRAAETEAAQTRVRCKTR